MITCHGCGERVRQRGHKCDSCECRFCYRCIPGRDEAGEFICPRCASNARQPWGVVVNRPNPSFHDCLVGCNGWFVYARQRIGNEERYARKHPWGKLRRHGDHPGTAMRQYHGGGWEW